MGLLTTVRDHLAMASGDYVAIFKDAHIPPLPAVVSQLLIEISLPEPDTARLESILSADPEIAVKVLRYANSGFYGLQTQVVSIRHAITLLGLRDIHTLVLSGAIREAIPAQENSLFDHQAYWTDAMVRSLLARSLALHGDFSTQADVAFTAMLLADVAVPVFLRNWRKYYESVVDRWRQTPQRLSAIERHDFGWDHAQAGAWILQYWGFPEMIISLAGSHTMNRQQIQELGLTDTVATVVGAAALAPSSLVQDPDRGMECLAAIQDSLQMPTDTIVTVLTEVQSDFEVISAQFNLQNESVTRLLANLRTALGSEVTAP
ncbi:MAG: HDOD domain-containing protein [bacterium]